MNSNNNKTPTKERIVESIVHWSSYMLENKLMTEDELNHTLQEGIFKRAVDAVKRNYKNAKDAVKSMKDNALEKIHDTFKTNKGVEKMLVAMNKIMKSGKDIKSTHLAVSVNGKDAGVAGFALADHKRKLLLLVDGKRDGMHGKTLHDLKRFIIVNKIQKIAAYIDAVVCASVSPNMSESIVVESKLSDYLASKKLSKEDALKPESLKQLKKLTKQNDEKTKAQVEKYFSSKGKDAGKKDEQKKPAAQSKSAEKKHAEAKPAEEQQKKPEAKSSSASSMKILDNKLNEVVPADNGDIIWFNFGPSKAAIAFDKKYADAFAL